MGVLDRMTRGILTILRNELEDPLGRGSDANEVFEGDGISSSFRLSNKLLKNVKEVRVNETLKFENEDYEVHFDEPSDPDSYPFVDFLSAPAPGDIISITYHYDQTWIYPQFPRLDASFPRISFEIVGLSEKRLAIGELFEAPSTKKRCFDASIYLDIWVKRGDIFEVEGKKYSGMSLVDYLGNQVLSAFQKEKLLRSWNISDWKLSGIRDWGYDEENELFRKTLIFSAEVWE